MRNKYILILLITTFAFSGCRWLLYPDTFWLNENKMDLEEITGFILGPLDSVDVFAKNGMIIHSGGMADMFCSYPITQFQSDFTAELTAGTGMNFYFRTIADHFEMHPNICFEFSTTGSRVFDSGKLITNVDTVKAELNKPVRILIENYGKLVNIVVDCDTVFYGRTALHATQHVLLKPLSGTNVRLTGIKFLDLNSDVKSIESWKFVDFLGR